MGQTMVEKIVSRKVGRPVRAGELIERLPIGKLFFNDVIGPPAILTLQRLFGETFKQHGEAGPGLRSAPGLHAPGPFDSRLLGRGGRRRGSDGILRSGVRFQGVPGGGRDRARRPDRGRPHRAVGHRAWDRLSHMHQRRHGRTGVRGRDHGRRICHGDRSHLRLRGSRDVPVRTDRTFSQRGLREGPHPSHHQYGGGGRLLPSGGRVRGRGRARSCPWMPGRPSATWPWR